jgi:hypothetical protein
MGGEDVASKVLLWIKLEAVGEELWRSLARTARMEV